MLAESDHILKEFKKKYPNGINLDIPLLKIDIQPVELNFEPMNLEFEKE